jgi:hypothetical protein
MTKRVKLERVKFNEHVRPEEGDVNVCPFCGSNNIEYEGVVFGDGDHENYGTPFHCHHCDSWFGVIVK